MQDNFEVVSLQLVQYMVQYLEVVLVGLGVDQKFISVHDDIGDVVKDSFHEMLETGLAAKEAHG